MTVDPRALRFAAWLTTIVLVLVLVLGSGWLLLAQTAIFAIGAVAGLRFSPYGLVFRRLVAPRLGPPGQTEPAAPPRFELYLLWRRFTVRRNPSRHSEGVPA